MNRRRLALLGGLAVALALLAFTAGVLVAQTPSPPATPRSDSAFTHEQMHRMMDAMHGEGTSQRMHEAMGEDAERMIDQCAAMMAMMGGMMGRGDGRSMLDMMDRMMGR